MAFFSAKAKPLSMSPPWLTELTVSQSASCCSLKGVQLPVAMNPGTFEGNPWSKTPSRGTRPWFFTGVTASFVVQSTKGSPTYSFQCFRSFRWRRTKHLRREPVVFQDTNIPPGRTTRQHPFQAPVPLHERAGTRKTRTRGKMRISTQRQMCFELFRIRQCEEPIPA